MWERYRAWVAVWGVVIVCYGSAIATLATIIWAIFF